MGKLYIKDGNLVVGMAEDGLTRLLYFTNNYWGLERSRKKSYIQKLSCFFIDKSNHAKKVIESLKIKAGN